MKNKKTNLKPMGTAICRTPAFSADDQLEECWPELKEMIRDSSPAFFSMINDLAFEQLKEAPEKIRYSIWKYFNRARFRATPFGNFAAISLVPVALNGQASLLTLDRHMMLKHFTDWGFKDILMDDLKKMTAESLWFRSNATYYTVGNEIRYVKQVNNGFELTAVSTFPELITLLNACRDCLIRQDTYGLMGSEFCLDQPSIDSLLLQLVSCQLLLTDRCPNITGEDYFERLSLAPEGPGSYIIAHRELYSGNLDVGPLRSFSGYFDFINNFLPESKNTDLDNFRLEFSRKFDQKAIPLALVMDPETGIGYGNLVQKPGDELVKSLQKTIKANSQFSYRPQHAFLLNALIKGGTISLDNYKSDLATASELLPNAFSVIFHYCNGQPVIESAAGCTANALLGRFTQGDAAAEVLGIEIAECEGKANPEILFFDVAYQAEKRVDNVNRRKILYQAELPLAGWSCHSCVLNLNDIFIAVRDGEVVLWSEKYGKRLVPRIASAYNYTRSDLAVYRFLCDLQHQGLRSSLSFSLPDIFPGLDHYPRVVYKNLIISPAMWRVNPLIFLPAGAVKAEGELQLKEWLRLKRIDFLFTAGNADQTLCFNPAQKEDLDAFMSYCRQNAAREFYIQEALLADPVKDEQGRPYAAQYVINYEHQERIYSPLQLASQPTNDVYLPGSDWLYVEIYCHPARNNYLLTDLIGPYLAKCKGLLQKWFFIRYNDPQPHIRLRMHLKQVSYMQGLIHELQLAAEPLHRQGIIADIQIKTYYREMERYGANHMDRVEDFFCRDSRYMLRLLKRNMVTDELYRYTLKLMEKWCLLALPDNMVRLDFIKTMADSFSREFSFGPADYKNINRCFEGQEEDKRTLLKIAYEPAFYKLMSACCEGAEKTNMLADLLHMHINRAFSADQRLHEAVLYQYLLQQAKRGAFRGKTAAGFLPIP
jgi:thiopeptide-type bacteriocin biosynthesis protein